MMKPDEYYKKLIAEITDDDVRKVARVMAEHVGEENAITLKSLCLKAGFFKQSDSGAISYDERKTRVILNTLVVEYGIPIGAFSGRAGRWICVNSGEVDRVVADLQSRVNETKARINALRLATIPAELDDAGSLEPLAPTLFELQEPEQKQEWWRWKSGSYSANYCAKG